MSLNLSSMLLKGVRRAAPGLLALAFALPASTHAQMLPIDPEVGLYAPDTGSSAAYRVNLLEGSGWFGTDFRLVSFLGGELWTVDSPLGFEFTGLGSSIDSLSQGSEIDESLDFTCSGFLTPGAWESGQPNYVGFHHQNSEGDWFGALAFRYNQDNSLSLLQFGVALDSFDTSVLLPLLPIPEPAGVAFALVLACGAAVVRLNRTKRPPDPATT